MRLVMNMYNRIMAAVGRRVSLAPRKGYQSTIKYRFKWDIVRTGTMTVVIEIKSDGR